MTPSFDWDPSKAFSNRAKHHIGFEFALTAFDDPFQLRAYDAVHSSPNEDREILIGRMDNGAIVTIVFVQIGEITRLISARRAKQNEKENYYENEKTQRYRS